MWQMQENHFQSQSSQTNLWRKSRFTEFPKHLKPKTWKKRRFFLQCLQTHLHFGSQHADTFSFPRLILCGKLFSDFVAAKSKQNIQNHKQGLTKTRICRFRYYLTSIYASETPIRSYFVKVEPKEENGSKVRLHLCPKQRQCGVVLKLWCQVCVLV